MDTPTSGRRSSRLRKSEINYHITPEAATPTGRRSLRNRTKSSDDKNDLEACAGSKTPKNREKSSRKAQEDSAFSPKKLRTNRTPSLKALNVFENSLENSPDFEEKKTPRAGRSKSLVNTPMRQNASGGTKTRIKKKQTKADSEEPPKKVKKATTASSSSEMSDDPEAEESFENIAKATTLFDEDEDVEGEKMFAFRTPKKKESMTLLAQHTPKTPRHNDPNKLTPRTPKTNRLSEIQNTPTSRPSASKTVKTPRHFREATKKRLNKMKQDLSDSDGDFSSDVSDFDPEISSSSEDSFENESETEASPPKKSQSVAARIFKTPSVASTATTAPARRSTRNKSDFQYVFQSDDYFSGAKAKAKTSDHTLDRLKNSRVPRDQLMALMANMHLSKEHEQAVKGLNEEHESSFDKWMILFDEGYTVLLYGFGSKRNLLQKFHKEKLAKRHVIVINGFFPSLTIREILDSIWVDILEQTAVGGNPHELLDMIEKEMKDIPALHLFLIIHNIDGPMLRNDRAQSVLSRLANIKNIHMIASIDHINTPLLWNNTKLSNFNFAWFDVTSFLPYADETAFESSLMVQNSGALELSSIRSVFQSLTNNAKGIYILLIKNQLANSKIPNYQGISIKDLYSACREAFFVSSLIALRAQLTEFLDHKLAKLKRTFDGAENITIPIKNVWLEQFLNEQ